jgi:hypothetical protein
VTIAMTKHKHIVSTIIAAIILIANVASAKDATWVDPDKMKMKAGDKAVVRVVVDEKGSFTAPSGWTTRFSQTKAGGGKITCAPDRPETCGVWISEASLNSDTNATFSYTPPTGPSSNHTVAFTVEPNVVVPPQPAAPPGGWYPADSGKKLETRVDNLEQRARENVSLFFDYKFTFNMPTTTDVGHGLQLGASAIVVDRGPAARLSVGGKFGWSRSKIEIDSSLNPTVTEGTEDRYNAAFTIGWTPCVQLDNRDFWCFNLGAMTGLGVNSYNQRFVRAERVNGVVTDVENVRERTQYSFILGPELYTNVRITPNFGIKLGFALPVTVSNVSRVIGKEDAPGVPEKGKPAVDAEVNGGVIFSF